MITVRWIMAAMLFSGVHAVGDECVEYHDYLSDLDYCADPLYWSHYKIRKDIDLVAAQAKALEDYVALRDGIWYNDELLTDTNTPRARLADCLGMAQRIVCHRNIPRCSSGEDTKLCNGLCKLFHQRCTIDNVNFLQRGMEDSAYLAECDSENTDDDHCSSAGRGAVMSAFAVAAAVVSALLIQRW